VPGMLKARAGITTAEFIVAMTLMAVLGAALTGVFVTQSRFFDTQTQTAMARGVSRGAMNLIMSELRMLEAGGGVVAASPKRVTVRAPYALGVVCGNAGTLTISQLPADPTVIAEAAYSGFAYRDQVTGTYTYVDGAGTLPGPGGDADCAAAGITVVQDGGGAFDGRALAFPLVPTPPPAIGAPVFLYQRITYEFRASAEVPDGIALWRRIDERDIDEEVVAPFDTTARFQFYVNDAAVAQATVPALLSTITGLELKLHGLIERPDTEGARHRLRLSTSVFFKNRM
jgi:hypothetical protein